MVKLAEFTGFRNAGGTVSGAPAKASIHHKKTLRVRVYPRLSIDLQIYV